MSALPPAPTDLNTATYSKTAIGLHEIQTRALGLSPLARRLLVLVDGKRSGQELAPFVNGHDVAELLSQLLAQGCIQAQAAVAPAPSPPAAPAAARGATSPAEGLDIAAQLAELPPAESRSGIDFDKARNFMTNTTNTMFGFNMRLTLIEAIHNSTNTEELRKAYPAWATTMAASGPSAKRLPELRKELFKVL